MSENNKNIFDAGGAGYIGSYTCVELLNAGYNVAVFDNFSNTHPQALKGVKKFIYKACGTSQVIFCKSLKYLKSLTVIRLMVLFPILFSGLTTINGSAMQAIGDGMAIRYLGISLSLQSPL